MIDEGLQRLLQAHHARHQPAVQHVHVERDARFQIGLAEQLLHQQFRLDRAALGRQHDADVFGAFVVDVVQQRHLLLLDQLGDALDQLGLLHLIGNLVDDDLVHAARAVFLVPAGADAERAAPGPVGFGDRLGVFDDDRRRSGNPGP